MADVIRDLIEQQKRHYEKGKDVSELSELSEDSEHSTVYCDTCYEYLDVKGIYTEDIGDMTLTLLDCESCGVQHVVKVDNKRSKKIVERFGILKRLERKLLHEYELETARAKKEYYTKAYNELSKEERELVGELHDFCPKDYENIMTQIIEANTITMTEAMKLWK